MPTEFPEIGKQLNSMIGQVSRAYESTPELMSYLRILAGNFQSGGWTEHKAKDIRGAVMNMLWALFPNIVKETDIPIEFWSTPLGELILNASIWADQDELLTLTQAANLSGRSLSHLSNYARGRIRSYTRTNPSNPTHGTIMLRKSDVLQLRPKRLPYK